MNDLRTAAQQALEAMRRAVPTGEITLVDWMKANHDLEAALAEPEPITHSKRAKEYRARRVLPKGVANSVFTWRG
jgi:hypothetical protein